MHMFGGLPIVLWQHSVDCTGSRYFPELLCGTNGPLFAKQCMKEPAKPLLSSKYWFLLNCINPNVTKSLVL